MANSAGTTRFLYDGDELVAEYNGVTGAFLRRYAHGNGVDDGGLVRWHQPTTLRWLHADHQGSIIAVSDAGSMVTNRNSYDE